MKAEDLHDMTPEQRYELFTRLAAKFYKTDKFASHVGRDMNYTPTAVRRWADNLSVPFPVIMLLDEWLNDPVRDLAKAQLDQAKFMKSLAESMQKASEKFALILQQRK